MVERKVEFALVLVGDIVVVADSFLRAVHETLQIFCKLSDCSAVGPTKPKPFALEPAMSIEESSVTNSSHAAFRSVGKSVKFAVLRIDEPSKELRKTTYSLGSNETSKEVSASER